MDRVFQNTRTRVPRSCFACRKKKRRCDRGSPCVNCLKSNTVELCVYEQFGTQTSGEMNSQTSMLMKELKAGQERIKYLETLIQLKNNEASSTELENENKEDLRLTANYDTLLVNEGRLSRTGPTSMRSNIINDSYCRQFMDDYTPIRIKGSKRSIEEDDISVNVVDTLNIYDEVNRAKRIFPEPSFALKLINRFFDYGPSSTAILQKDKFLSDVWTIIDTNGKDKLKIKKGKHYVILAELLVVLRSAYVTFLGPNNVAHDESSKSILEGNLVITSEYGDIASRILLALEVSGFSTLSLVQANVLFLHYKRHSREGYSDEFMLSRLNVVAHILRSRGLTTECPNAKDFLTASEIFYWKQLWVVVLLLYTSLCYDAGVSFPVSEEELNISINVGDEKAIITEIPSMRVLAMEIYWVKLTSSIIRDSHKPQGITRGSIYNFIDDSNRLLASMNSIDSLVNSSGNVKERLEEFRLRMDITIKLFSTHFKLSSILIKAEDDPLRTDQYFQAFAHGLTVLKLASDLMTSTDKSDFWGIISPTIYNALTKVAVLSCSLYSRVYEGIIIGVDFVKFLQQSQFYSLVDWLELSHQDIIESQVIASLNEKFWNVYVNLKINTEVDFFKGKSFFIIKNYLIPFLNSRFDFAIFRQDEHNGTDPLIEPDNYFSFLLDNYFDLNFGV